MRNGRVTMEGEVGRIRKGALLAHFKVLSQYLPGENDEDYEKIQSG
jgi:hypothetical protein